MRLSKKYIIWIILCFSIFLSIYLLLALYIGINAEHDTKSKSDAILVLGARSYIDGKYNPCLKARVEHAVELYKSKYASKILMTGGNDTEDNVNEAEIMRKIAVESGVSSKDILLEKRATSTYENLTFSQAIFKKYGLKSVKIITEPFHAARAALVADKLGMKHTLSPASTSPCWLPWKYFSGYFLKEPFAIIMYKLQNKL
ncbi:YdcF family protein [Patescibacteria group bacterium]|nr:YdcF family protein [Patescibacteria group bacterium]MBU4016377.1 YdcF family protein [Patescibacteria group bacterium]MBU4099052.1 YdcF family protein [Patescibacteria group bacterium]